MTRGIVEIFKEIPDVVIVDGLKRNRHHIGEYLVVQVQFMERNNEAESDFAVGKVIVEGPVDQTIVGSTDCEGSVDSLVFGDFDGKGGKAGRLPAVFRVP